MPDSTHHAHAHAHAHAVSPTPSPLALPELLQSIFTHLSPYVLRTAATLVCRHWHRVAQSILRMPPVVWIETSSTVDHTQREHHLQRLGLTNTLILRADPLLHGRAYPDPLYWDRHMDLLQTVKHEHRLNITKLSIHRHVQISRLFALLDLVAPNLTELKFTGRTDDCESDVPLDKILILVPHLITLHLHYSGPSCYAHVHAKGQQPDLELPTRLNLRSLTLHGISVQSIPLLRLLESCPDLESLYLIDLHQDRYALQNHLANFRQKTFVEQFSRHCPNLRTFHLSLWESPWRYWANWMLQYFPQVRGWSFKSWDVDPDLIKALSQSPFDGLTLLEMTGSYQWPETALAVHKFMCQSPHLLHLKTCSVDISIRWMDLEQILTPVGYSRQRYLGHLKNETTLDPCDSPVRRHTIWACRQLRTLHISCLAANDHTAENTRVLFGYLSRVCPQLQDLEISRRCLNMQLEGGICLLTRLHDLRRLKITMEFEGQGEKGETPPPSSLSLCPSSPSPRYVDWIQMFITPELRTQLLSQLEDIGDGDSSSSSGSDSNSKGNGDQRGIKIAVGQKPHLSRRSIPTRVPFLSQENKENKTYREWDSQYFMIDGVDMRNLGQWKDITDLFQDRLLKNWCCWPQLEYLEIQVKTDVDPDFRRQNTRSGSISKESTRRSVEVVNLMKHRIRELRRDIEVV